MQGSRHAPSSRGNKKVHPKWLPSPTVSSAPSTVTDEARRNAVRPAHQRTTSLAAAGSVAATSKSANSADYVDSVIERVPNSYLESAMARTQEQFAAWEREREEAKAGKQKSVDVESPSLRQHNNMDKNTFSRRVPGAFSEVHEEPVDDGEEDGETTTVTSTNTWQPPDLESLGMEELQSYMASIRAAREIAEQDARQAAEMIVQAEDRMAWADLESVRVAGYISKRGVEEYDGHNSLTF